MIKGAPAAVLRTPLPRFNPSKTASADGYGRSAAERKTATLLCLAPSLAAWYRVSTH